jgi:hypothetical protein
MIRCLRRTLQRLDRWFAGLEDHPCCSACGHEFREDGTDSDPSHPSVCCNCFDHCAPAYERSLNAIKAEDRQRQPFVANHSTPEAKQP